MSAQFTSVLRRHNISWSDRFFAFRDGLLANPRFQRWAASFPLTRPIVQHRAGALFDLCAGFVYTQVLLACVRLRLFDTLAAGPQSAPALAVQLALRPDATLRLLDAAVALRLVERRSGERYGLGPLGAPMVGNGAIAAMVEHHALVYGDLGDPVALLRGNARDTALSSFWPYASTDRPDMLCTKEVAPYTDLMAQSQSLIADQVLDAYPVAKHRCLLDVGGGDGRFCVAVAEREPDLRLMLFDLPAIARRAGTRFTEAGISGRAKVFGGDFLTDPLPNGADLISLVRVIHDHDDARALRLLRAARQALPAHGTLLLAEPMSGTPGAEAMGDAYFGFYLLAMGRGQPRTRPQLETLLRAAGFGRIRMAHTATPLQTRLLVAHPVRLGENPSE